MSQTTLSLRDTGSVTRAAREVVSNRRAQRWKATKLREDACSHRPLEGIVHGAFESREDELDAGVL
jgi:hypothetical protein